MLRIDTCSISCGVRLIGGETNYLTAETFFQDFYALWKSTGRGFTQYVYSHSPIIHQIGDRIKKYIEDNNLGVVTVSPVGLNPVHGSKICVYVWTMDYKAFTEHAKTVEVTCLK